MTDYSELLQFLIWAHERQLSVADFYTACREYIAKHGEKKMELPLGSLTSEEEHG